MGRRELGSAQAEEVDQLETGVVVVATEEAGVWRDSPVELRGPPRTGERRRFRSKHRCGSNGDDELSVNDQPE